MLLDPDEVTEDRLLGGRVRLRQVRSGHRAGTDAVLLAGLCGARAGEHVVDLGSASGAVGLMIAERVPTARVSLIEREPALVALARGNITLNGFEGRVSAIERDVFSAASLAVHSPPRHPDEPAKQASRRTQNGEACFETRSSSAPQHDAGSGFPSETIPRQDDDDRAEAEPEPADLVVTNPPFFEEPRSIRASPDAGRRKAHVMEGGGLRDWLAAAALMLRPRGRLALIHRADALGLCLAALPPDFGAPEVMPIHPRAGRNATRILVFARRGGRSPLVLLPPLVLHADRGGFTPEAARLHDPEVADGGAVQGSGTKAAR